MRSSTAVLKMRGGAGPPIGVLGWPKPATGFTLCRLVRPGILFELPVCRPLERTRCLTRLRRTRVAYVAQKPIFTSFCIGARARGIGASDFGLSCRPESDLGDLPMRIIRATAFVACLSTLCLAGTAHADSYSKAVRKSCAADYHKYCGDYGIETAGLRSCMDRNGKSLSKSCVNALVSSGEVTQAEVDRRKNGH